MVESGRLILTEPWVNERYRIDYQRGPEERLLVLFHKENPPNRYQMRVQFYMPAGWFDLPAGKSAVEAPGQQAARSDNGLLLVAGLAVIAAFFGVVKGKQRSMLAARRGLDEIRWENLDWTPPKLILSEFRKPGKVCKELTPLEAAFYLEIPFKRILAAMLNAMVAEGFLEVASESPLRVKVLRRPDLESLDDYERLFYEALEDDGRLSQAELEALMNEAVKRVQLKAWDADVEATKAYYREQVETYLEKAKEPRPESEELGWYLWYHHSHPYYRHSARADERVLDRYAAAMPVTADHIVHGPWTAPSPPNSTSATTPATAPVIPPATRPVTAPAIPPAIRPA